MKIFEKRKFDNGMRQLRLFGFCIFTYFARGGGRVHVNGVDNVVQGCPRTASVILYGNNNTIEIGPTDRRFQAKFMIGTASHPVKNCRIILGRDCSCEKSKLILAEDDSEIIIGDDAQIAYEVEIRATDCHTILDADGKATNRGRFVHIGKHCWIAARSTILKNVVIPEGSVVGASAVVTPSSVRDAGGEAVILAGNPARIVKRGIRWDRRRPDEFDGAKVSV